MVSFSFVGRIVPVKDTDKLVGYEEKTFSSGWMIQRLRWNMVCGDNKHMVEINAGRWADDSKNSTIYTYSKATKGKKSEPLMVKWEQRNDPAIIDSVAGYRVFTMDTDNYKHREELKQAGQLEELAKSEKKRRHFIAGVDFIEYVRKVIASGEYENAMFRVNGSINYSYNESKDQYYETYEVNKIYRVDDDAQPDSSLNVDFYYTKNFMDKESLDEGGKAIMSGWTPFYDNKTKHTWFRPLSIVVRDSKEGVDSLEGLMDDFNDNEVNRIPLSCQNINGAQRRSVTFDDLDEKTQKAIRAGHMDEQKAIQKVGGFVKGGYVREFRYVEMSDQCKETVYTVEMCKDKPHEIIDIFEGSDEDI